MCNPCCELRMEALRRLTWRGMRSYAWPSPHLRFSHRRLRALGEALVYQAFVLDTFVWHDMYLTQVSHFPSNL